MPHTLDIGFQLHSLSNLMRRRMEHSEVFSHMDDNVTRNNGWILNYLAHHSDRDIYQKDIENDFCIRPSTVSKVIRLMESKSLLCREAVPGDARLKKLSLTDLGTRACEQSMEAFHHVEGLAIRELPSTSQREYEAVRRAVETTEHYRNGQERLKVIELVLWKKTHNLQGAALQIPCHVDTAKVWHGDFIRLVASYYGLMDE